MTSLESLLRLVIRGAGLSAIARAFSVALSFAFASVAALWFGAGELGLAALLNSALLILGTLASGGPGLAVVKEVAGRGDQGQAGSDSDRRVAGFYVVSVAAAIAIAGCVLLLQPLLGDAVARGDDWSPTWLLAASLVPFVLLSLVTQDLRAQKRAFVFAVAQVLPSFCSLMLLLIAGTFGVDHAPAAAQLLAYWLSLALLLVFVRGCVSLSSLGALRTTDAALLRSSTVVAFPMGVASVLQMVLSNGGMVLAGWLVSPAAAGHLAVATRFVNLSGALLSTINSMAAPAFSQLGTSGERILLLRLFRKISALSFAAAVLFSIAVVILGPELIRMLFGESFAPAHQLILVLLIGQVVNGFCGSTGVLLNMTGHAASLARCLLVGVLVFSCISLLFVHDMGVFAIVAGSAAGTVTWNVLSYLSARTVLGAWPFFWLRDDQQQS